MTRITDLEDALREDREGRLREHLMRQLGDAASALRIRLRAPHDAAAYACLVRCELACVSACSVIDTLWGRYHGGKPIRRAVRSRGGG